MKYRSQPDKYFSALPVSKKQTNIRHFRINNIVRIAAYRKYANIVIAVSGVLLSETALMTAAVTGRAELCRPINTLLLYICSTEL